MATKTKKKLNKKKLVTLTCTFQGKRIYARGKTAAIASANLEKHKQELANKTASSSMLLDKYYSMWKERRRDQVKDSTLRKQQFQYDAISEAVVDAVGHRMGELKLSDITASHVWELQKALKTRRSKVDGHLIAKRKPSSINGAVALLSHIMEDAVEDGLIQKNPCKPVKDVKSTEVKARDTIHRALTKEETRDFLDAAADSWNYNLYIFMLNTGCRIGEVGALTEDDIRDGKIYIKGTITKNEHGNRVIGKSAKTANGTRVIPATAAALQAVHDQLAINIAVFGKAQDTIFRTSIGNQLNDDTVRRDMKAICETIGIEKLTTHALRDTFATRAVESGMNFKTLQAIMGHSDIKVTLNLYAHVMEDTKQEEMERLAIV